MTSTTATAPQQLDQTPEPINAPALDVLLAQAKTKADLQDVVRMMHGRNMRLQAVRDQLSHELHSARVQVLDLQGRQDGGR